MMKPSHRLPLPCLAAILCLAAGSLRGQDATPTPSAENTKVETLVFVRHGEKPDDDEGQLTAQGLNRALALPDVLITKFGHGDFVYAPATTKKPATHHHAAFSYVRPLMTIEPTAIRLGLPVETKFALDEIAGLQSELCMPALQQATIFIAWEHHYLDEIVKKMVSAFGGNADSVPEWADDDFDSIFVVRLRTDPQGRRSVTFEHDLERLNGQSTAFPAPAAKP